jgi:hypothetical protein
MDIHNPSVKLSDSHRRRGALTAEHPSPARTERRQPDLSASVPDATPIPREAPHNGFRLKACPRGQEYLPLDISSLSPIELTANCSHCTTMASIDWRPHGRQRTYRSWQTVLVFPWKLQWRSIAFADRYVFSGDRRLCPYLPLLTQNYDITSAKPLVRVRPRRGTVESQSHALPSRWILRAAEPGGHRSCLTSIPVLQFLSAIFERWAWVSHTCLQRLTQNRTIAIWMSAPGVSWSYWTLSTDVYYQPGRDAGGRIAGCVCIFPPVRSPESTGLLVVVASSPDCRFSPANTTSFLFRRSASGSASRS